MQQASSCLPVRNEVQAGTRSVGLGNKYLFNGGSELNEKTQNYETFYRNYDATLGRFNGIDIKATKYASLSPYQFAGNNPVSFNDPMGDDMDNGIAQWAVDRENWIRDNFGIGSLSGGGGGASGGVWTPYRNNAFDQMYYAPNDYTYDPYGNASSVLRDHNNNLGGIWNNGASRSFTSDEDLRNTVDKYNTQHYDNIVDYYFKKGSSAKNRVLAEYNPNPGYYAELVDGKFSEAYVPGTNIDFYEWLKFVESQPDVVENNNFLPVAVMVGGGLDLSIGLEGGALFYT